MPKIIFDFDGTLVDSMPKLRDLATTIIEDYYDLGPDIADDMYMATIGRSFREQLDVLFPEGANSGLNKRAADAFFDQQVEIYDSVHPHIGVVDTVQYLNDQQVQYAAVSSTDGRLASRTLLRLIPEFDGIITGRDFGSKGSQLMSQAKSDPSSVFIGDAIYDGDIADEIGIRFIAVSHTKSMIKFYEAGFEVYDSVPGAVSEALRKPQSRLVTHGGTTSMGGYISPENTPRKARG